MASHSTKGFTLVEVVLSIGIVTAIMIPLVLLLGHGLNHAEDVTLRDRVLRLAPTVENTLNHVPFEQLRGWVDGRQSLYAYVYRGKDSSAQSDGKMGAATTGKDTFYAVARPPSEAGRIAHEAKALNGHMFRVELTHINPLATADSRAKETSLNIQAKFSRVLVPSQWGTSDVVPQMSLNYVVNR